VNDDDPTQPAIDDPGYRPPADPAHPELGPSEYAAAAIGVPSRLTDAERRLLATMAMRQVAHDLDVDEQEAADLLEGYADRGDPCRFVGDRLEVAVVAAGVELVRVDRVTLRAMATSGNGTLN
jgi:hypothetical protein